MYSPENEQRSLLAIYPFHRGIGFAVVDPERGLVEWGVSRARRGQDREILSRLDRIFERYLPTGLVVENAADTPRGPEARRLTQTYLRWGLARGMAVHPVSRAQVRQHLGGAADQLGVATEVARQYPELEPRLPKKRRPWESVDERSHLFSAVAMGLVALETCGAGRVIVQRDLGNERDRK